MNRIFNYIKEESKFNYSIDNFDKITTSDFFEAVDKTVKDVLMEMQHLKLNKVALLISGIDSEIIARYLYLNKVDTEYYFLHILGVNDEHKQLVEKISKKYKTKLNIISIDEKTILDKTIFESFNICEVKIATYLTIPHLIKFIPDDFYIIIGEGDIEKTNVNKYLNIYYQKIKNFNSGFYYIPMHLSEIMYRSVLNNYNKLGESNFYSRVFDIWYHILSDSRLRTNGKFFYDPKTKLLNEICKNDFISPTKTLNFQYLNSKRIIDQIEIKLLTKQSDNWHPCLGDVVKVPKDLLI